jgi:arylsulfatase A-like enzyme
MPLANQLDEHLTEVLPIPDRPYALLIKYDARDPEARFPPIEPPDDASSDGDYHFSVDMTNQAIAWVPQQPMLMPHKPFFMYYAPGACHAPHHMHKERIDNYKGKFDQGWDHVREETLARQKEPGVVPPATHLTKRHEEIPARDTLSDDQKLTAARMMQVDAAFLEHTDVQVGRPVDDLEETGVFENTLFLYIIGDNGASAEGTLNGTTNPMLTINGFAPLEDNSKRFARFTGQIHSVNIALGDDFRDHPIDPEDVLNGYLTPQ